MAKQEFDKQGKYFWHLVKTAGWTQERVNKLLVKHFAATHWNALLPGQKRAAINMMHRYASQGRAVQNKRMRSTIMSLVAKRGYSKEWLYETLNISPERTLSKMDWPELNEVFKSVKLMFDGKRNVLAAPVGLDSRLRGNDRDK